MLRRFRGRRFFAVFFLALALFALFFFLGNEGYRSPISRKTRKSLLIIGRGRSGTSFVSKMIASGNEVSNITCVPHQNCLLNFLHWETILKIVGYPFRNYASNSIA